MLYVDFKLKLKSLPKFTKSCGTRPPPLLEEIELEDNKIKGWEDKIKPIQETYKDFFTVSEEQGQGVNIPPVNNSNQDKTNPLADALGKLI